MGSNSTRAAAAATQHQEAVAVSSSTQQQHSRQSGRAARVGRTNDGRRRCTARRRPNGSLRWPFEAWLEPTGSACSRASNGASGRGRGWLERCLRTSPAAAGARPCGDGARDSQIKQVDKGKRTAATSNSSSAAVVAAQEQQQLRAQGAGWVAHGGLSKAAVVYGSAPMSAYGRGERELGHGGIRH